MRGGPRLAIIWTRSRELSLKARYHLTHRMMISWSKCRPLNRSCAEVGSVIPAVIAGYRAFQQFAPEPSKRHCRNTDNETAKHSRIGIGARLQNVKVAIFQVFAHASRGYILNVTICQIQV